MTQKERIEALEQKIAALEARLASVEARPIYVPTQPYPQPYRPYQWWQWGAGTSTAPPKPWGQTLNVNDEGI